MVDELIPSILKTDYFEELSRLHALDFSRPSDLLRAGLIVVLNGDLTPEQIRLIGLARDNHSTEVVLKSILNSKGVKIES